MSRCIQQIVSAIQVTTHNNRENPTFMIICPIAMKTYKYLLFVCNFYLILMKFCTAVQGPESKIAFVCGQNPMMASETANASREKHLLWCVACRRIARRDTRNSL